MSTAFAAPTEIPPGKALLPPAELLVLQLEAEPDVASTCALSPLQLSNAPSATGWRLEVSRAPLRTVEWQARNSQPSGKGDVALLRFFARAVSTSDETGRACFQVMIRRADGGNELQSDLIVGREWQEILLPFAFSQDVPAGSATLVVDNGPRRQTFEICGIAWLNYGQSQTLASLPRTRFTYSGREPDAAWRREALARIEKLRKADFQIRVVDEHGRPVRGARVRVTQRRSAFQWGTCVRMFMLARPEPEYETYRAKLAELFNAATDEMGLKWYCWLGERGAEYSPPATLFGLRWLKERGFHVRGHVFVWPSWGRSAKFARDLRGTPRESELPRLVIQHIRDLSIATRGLLDEWDVLNETFTHHDYMDLFGRDIMLQWFATAAELLPGVPLYFNDYGNHDQRRDPLHVDDFESTARYLLQHQAPLHGLGLQAHFGGQLSNPADVLATLDRYSALKLPIRFTEFDVWTGDEQLQADFTRDFLILAYSHPSVVGVQLWGFWETAHWRPSAAMFRSDWSAKPNARVYESLVRDQWMTRIDGTTDAEGRLAGRGHLGDYHIDVSTAGIAAQHHFTLTAKTSLQTITVHR